MESKKSNLIKNLQHNDEVFISLFKDGTILKKLHEFLLNYIFAKQDQDGFIIKLDEEESVFISMKSKFSLYGIKSISKIETGDFYFYVILNLKDDSGKELFITICMNYDLSVYDVEFE
jgi:hypothetical protein